MMVNPKQPTEAAPEAYGAGDFDRFFEDQRARVLKLCWFSTLDDTAAADVAQEAFARAYANWESIRSDHPKGWIRTVALNLSRDRWRKENRMSVVAPPEISRLDRYEDTDLFDALRLLPGRQREVVMLRYWADLKLNDCATAMDISVSAAKTHLTRAHLRLRELLGPDVESEFVA